MKYLLTESKLEKIIENFILNEFSDLNVISVSFKEQGVYLASDDKSITRNVICVVVDPFNRSNGNLEDIHNRFPYDIRRNLFNSLDSMFGLGLTEYGSEWELEVYGVTLIKI
jgi:hypothetical protein